MLLIRDKRKYGIVVILLMLFTSVIHSQTPLVPYSWKLTSQISPYYFGPCAFPVPEMIDGSTQEDISIELTSNGFIGYQGDYTLSFRPQYTMPLYTPRVNISLWGHMVEWYKNSDERLKVCRLDTLVVTNPNARKGVMVGDVYVSTNIHVMLEGKYNPDIMLRAVLKTASGNGYDIARFYDAAGYFFDVTAGKGKQIGEHNLRAALSGGFLCWQTSAGRQNDAIMYGMLVSWRYKKLYLSYSISGYSGWENRDCIPAELARDQPIEMKTQLRYRLSQWEVIAGYQKGLRDYPFHQIQVGAAYHIELSK